MRVRTPACTSLLLLTLFSGCVPTSGAEVASQQQNESSGHTLVLPPGVDEQLPPAPVPPPPAPAAAAPRRAVVVRSDTGVPVCISERPELAEVFVGVSLLEPEAPEDRLLLRTWLEESLAEGGSFRLSAQCERFFICAWLPHSSAISAARKLGEFFAQPRTSTFYPARQRAMEKADELYQRSATFRLSALGQSMAAGRVTKLGANWAEPKVLDAVLGPPRMLQITPADLARELLAGGLSFTVEGSGEPHAVGAALLEGFKTSKQVAVAHSPARSRASSRWATQDTHLVIVDARFPQSQLYLTWLEITDPGDARILHVLHALKNEVMLPGSVAWAQVHEGDDLAPRPALLVQGPHEILDVLAGRLSARAAELLRSIPSDTPTASEGPCGAAVLGGSAPPILKLGVPQVIVWGSSASEETSEDL